MKKTISGFTIVELLIVIVVIAILASISVVAYNGIQGRGRDARRLSDMNSIQKALDIYRAQYGQYPTHASSGAGPQEGWEASSREAAGEFIAPLKNVAFTSGVPVDPINNATENIFNDSRANSKYGYYYYLYPAGHGSCPVSNGNFYVLGILRTDVSGNAAHPQSPGFNCPGRDWRTEFSWVVGKYEN